MDRAGALEQLTTLLEDWPRAHLREVVLPYLHGVLADDVEVRWAPQHWFKLQEPIAVHEAWPLVTGLDLSTRELGDEGARALARSPLLSTLRGLALFWCGLGDEGVYALAQSPYLGELTYLNLNHNEISEHGLMALIRAPQLRKLTKAKTAG